MKRPSPARARGAALIVGLVLLLVLTVLGVSGINMATLELTMTGNAQAAQYAFQAAETGIEHALAGPVDTDAPQVYTDVPMDAEATYSFSAEIACVATTPVPDGAYSEGGGVQAIHFEATSTGRGPRNAVSVHRQGVYILGPDPGNANFDPADLPGSC